MGKARSAIRGSRAPFGPVTRYPRISSARARDFVPVLWKPTQNTFGCSVFNPKPGYRAKPLVEQLNMWFE